MDLIVTVVVAVALFIIFAWLMVTLFVKPDGKNQVLHTAPPGAPVCPLCSRALADGELVKAKSVPDGTTHRIVHVFGCSGCYPPNAIHVRLCPVCCKQVPRQGYAIARANASALNRRDRGAAVMHYLGCTGCRPTGIH